MKIHIEKLIHNLPNVHYGEINLVLDGGAFSGSYILGALHYIKHLQDLNRIQINKLSGSSIGTILCILFKLNKLDYIDEIYTKVRNYFKKYGHLHILPKILNSISQIMPTDFYMQCNDNLFISYHDIKIGRAHV